MLQIPETSHNPPAIPRVRIRAVNLTDADIVIEGRSDDIVYEWCGQLINVIDGPLFNETSILANNPGGSLQR